MPGLETCMLILRTQCHLPLSVQTQEDAYEESSKNKLMTN